MKDKDLLSNDFEFNDFTGEKETFGNILARERKKRGLSLYQLSEMLGLDEDNKPLVSPSHISKIEKNTRDNPSFKLVCLIASKLSLDLREILKCYGYEDLLPSNLSHGLKRVEDIIRLSSIEAPINCEDDLNLKKEDIIYEPLSQEEKEILINVLNYIFMYSTCDLDLRPYYISLIILELDSFCVTRGRDMSHVIYKFEKEIKISIHGKARNSIKLDEIPPTFLFRWISNAINEMDEVAFSELGEFYISNSEVGIVIKCRKVHDEIQILEVSNSVIVN